MLPGPSLLFPDLLLCFCTAPQYWQADASLLLARWQTSQTDGALLLILASWRSETALQVVKMWRCPWWEL